MNIYVSNFLRHVADTAKRRRWLLIKAAAVIVVALFLTWLIIYTIERVRSASYDRGVAVMEKEIHAIEDRARYAEARAEMLEEAIRAKYVEIEKLKKESAAAETKWRESGRKVVTLKEAYETIRYVPVAGPVSLESVCAELAALSYPCK